MLADYHLAEVGGFTVALLPFFGAFGKMFVGFAGIAFRFRVVNVIIFAENTSILPVRKAVPAIGSMLACLPVTLQCVSGD